MSDIKTSNRGRKRTLTDSARKRNRNSSKQKWNQTRVYIGDQHDRWNHLKDALGAQTHAEVAKILLDSYYSKREQQTSNVLSTQGYVSPAPIQCMESSTSNVMQEVVTSTPGHLLGRENFLKLCEISDISSAGGNRIESENGMSGIEELESFVNSKRAKLENSSSFVNPFDLSVDVTEDISGMDHDSSDEDFKPSLNFTLRPNNTDHLPLEESDESDTDGNDPADEIEDPGLGIRRLNYDDVDILTNDRPLLVYQQQLVELANIHISRTCIVSGCGEQVKISTEIVASAIYIKWICGNRHLVYRWCSQPLLNRRMHAGDLLMAASILISGNNFQKITMLAKFMKLPILSTSTFHRIQRSYIVPTVDKFWVQQQEEVLQEFQDKDVIVLGDGRMDSPGHSAQYCSYTFMEYNSKKILFMITMDKRSTDRKSTNLEKACFQRGMQFFAGKGIRVVEVVTDAHTQIAALMKKDYPNIKHSFDVWHGTKNLGKKLAKIAQEKDKKDLLVWVKDIVNHFWYTANIAKTVERFLDIWYGVLHHVVDEHEWPVPYSDPHDNLSILTGCQHGPLEENNRKCYLKKGSAAHNALRELVMDKYLVNRVHYYLNFRSTSELETFQNLILVYASKRHSYGPPVFRARNLLAVLDHNIHVDRPVMLNKDGSTRWQRSYNKKTAHWSVQPVKEPKLYHHIPSLIREIVCARLADDVGMNRRVELEVDDPRRISKHLAPVPPPSTLDIVGAQKSRFGDMDKTEDYSIE